MNALRLTFHGDLRRDWSIKRVECFVVSNGTHPVCSLFVRNLFMSQRVRSDRLTGLVRDTMNILSQYRAISEN